MSGPRETQVSAREAEVLALLGEHRTNAEIAARLFISVRTVESHVSSLLRKHGVPDRRALSALAAPAGGGPPAAPPRVTGLPPTASSFVGRGQEREQVAAVLTEARLVTLVGPGGVGKTRLATALAAELAPRFRDGGAFVDLVPVRSGYVVPAVAAALGVTPAPSQPLLGAVTAELGTRRLLLVIDNCEHLLDAAAAFVAEVLSACPGVTVLATSREQLGAAEERVVRIGPLSDSAGRTLFDDRARAAGADVPGDPALVGELCGRLDNMPLAIELAAARSASLGPAGLLTALADPLRALAGARRADARHRSLRAVLGWSYDLLRPAEQALFRRLSVFAGGFDLAAAAAVCGAGDPAGSADLLGRLVDKSLVTRERDPGRWRLLGTVRAFAREQLDADPARGDVSDRYLEWAASVAADLAGRLDGHWRDDYDLVADDLRAALLGRAPGRDPAAHRLARALGRLTYARRFLAESLDYYRQAAVLAGDPAEAARDLRSAADCALIGTEPGARVLNLLLAAADQAGVAGDGNAEALALARVVELVHRFDGRIATGISRERLTGLLERARAAGDAADPVVAATLAIAAAWHAGARPYDPDPALAEDAERIARRSGDPVLVSAGLDVLGTAATQRGRAEQARRIGEQRLALLDSLDRTDPRTAPEIGDILLVAATVALRAGDLPGALRVARRMDRDDLLGDRSYRSIGTMVPALVLNGELDEALARAETLWDGWRRNGRPPSGDVASAMAFALLACGLRGDRAGLPYWRQRLRRCTSGVDVSSLASAVFAAGRVALHLADFTEAAGLVEQSFGEFPNFRYDTYARAVGAELGVAAGLPDAAGRLAAAERSTAGNAWAAACLARARGRLTGDPDAIAATLPRWERLGARAEYACTLALLPGREAEARTELTALGIAPPHR
ncbi:LuxR C-terminal-related transcriptional regulator [Micromonospora sp. C28SCA-DRY-2]|uniref:ATP-binding protein n=1 Tax=Micromonospora sp. C28SCA-DRY-2 TaxID=3059522 RepID=UPI002675EF6A|nr:LuxR C-terminal-related transcriptional regulator [Micromonospora sp. C28SCA-DRY-2]MDO3705972.1 LuxR C-terminal-related transcriptional regulator [Micromonospora sp. C28SCA-DRY-2]